MARFLVVALLVSLPVHAAVVPVSTVAELRSAIAAAQAGDEIVLADGTYDLTTSVTASAEGTAAQKIVVRAATPLGAKIRVDTLEGFKVTGAHWVFDGLDVEGVCAVDSNCEHAFHVTGHAEGFVLRRSRVRDFNAQLKVNATKVGTTWEIPHGGIVELSELADTRPRATSNPVTKLNIDTGDGWIVRDNYIHDFQKDGGNFISYGAFMKSGGKNGVFERNLVVCARDFPAGGTRIGLSFGGGGTGNQFCAPAFDAAVPCDPEHSNGVMRNNIIANCSDVGIYLNKAANTRILYNTLVATNGVDFRYASSTGEAHGNVLASIIRQREGGTFVAGTNLLQVSSTTFNGWYQAPVEGDLRTKTSPTQLLNAAAPHPEVSDDFCARARSATNPNTLGALEHSLGDCSQWPGNLGPQDGGGSDAGVADAGEPDAGAPDAGGETDAGTQPNPNDGGSLADPDAGTQAADAGDTMEPIAGGCGCSAEAQLPPFALGLIVLLAGAVRGRRSAKR